MSEAPHRPGQGERFLNRLATLRAAGKPVASAFLSQPEPRTVGSLARGRQLVAGNLIFAGQLVEAKDADLWSLSTPDFAFEADCHGFIWLDDLAAVGTAEARALAQKWLWGWIERYGKGRMWVADLTGRRVIRWVSQALFVLRGMDAPAQAQFFRVLSRQVWFLSRRWKATHPGLPRFEALTGLIYAALSLEGMEDLADPAIRALSQECASQIDEIGGITTRNPEELLEIFNLLIWSAMALHDAGRGVPAPHQDAIQRIAPALRTLRHADGGLARFHGGGRGLEGRLEHALAESHTRDVHRDGLAMGYQRLMSGRSTVIIDASKPPGGNASGNAHASTLAFELTSGRRPLITNCGSGVSFGPEWRRAARATPSHSTLCLEGHSSAQLDPTLGSAPPLTNGPAHVPLETAPTPTGHRFQGAHDGYERRFGLTHARTLGLSLDGRELQGEDMLLAMNDPAKQRFDQALDRTKLSGLRFDLRFHLHPEVDVSADLAGSTISMALKSGEIWLFRWQGAVEMALEPSVFLEQGRLKPRATKQIVLSGRTIEYATRVRWSLAKAQETALAVRDVGQEDLLTQD